MKKTKDEILLSAAKLIEQLSDKPSWVFTVDGEALLTYEQAALFLNYHPASVRHLFCQGKIKPYMNIGKNQLFALSELVRYQKATAFRWAKSAKPIDRKNTVDFPGMV